MNSRPSANPFGADLLLAASGADRFDVIYHANGRNVLAPQWSPRGDRIIFGIGFDGENFFPVGPIAIFDTKSNGRADGLAVANSRKDFRAGGNKIIRNWLMHSEDRTPWQRPAARN